MATFSTSSDQTSVRNPCLAAARCYAQAGLYVFPVPVGTKMSYKSAGRSNDRRWGATVDLAEIEADFRRWPSANVGIACGKDSGIFIVETDTAAGHGAGVDGEASLRKLKEQFGGGGHSIRTLTAVSPSGSRHYYFQYPHDNREIRNSTSTLGSGIDVRGEGGMVLAVPSLNRFNQPYRWLNKESIKEAPEWLLALISRKQRKRFDAEQQYDESAGNEFLTPLVAYTVARIPPERDSWHVRNSVGMAIFACTGGSTEGRLIWKKWLEASGRFDERKANQRWHAMSKCPPTQVTYNALHTRAMAADDDFDNALDRRLFAMNRYDDALTERR